jgi:nitrogenase subunit NifH
MRLVGVIPQANIIQRALTQRVPIVAYDEDHEVSKRFVQIAKTLVQKGTATIRLGSLNAETLVQGLMADREIE